jgi:hypothetical protein
MEIPLYQHDINMTQITTEFACPPHFLPVQMLGSASKSCGNLPLEARMQAARILRLYRFKKPGRGGTVTVSMLIDLPDHFFRRLPKLGVRIWQKQWLKCLPGGQRILFPKLHFGQ